MKGKDILIFVNTGTDAVPVWTKVGGQRGATFTEESDTIDLTTKDSDGATESDYGNYSWSISFDGLYVPDEVGYARLQTAMRNKEKVMVQTKEDGADLEQGLALVTSLEKDAPHDGEVTYSGELTGTGKLTPVV